MAKKKQQLTIDQEMGIEFVEALLKEMKAHPELLVHWEIHRDPLREQPDQFMRYHVVMRVPPPPARKKK